MTSDVLSYSSCESWNRTNGLPVQSRALLPTATISQYSFSIQHGYLPAPFSCQNKPPLSGRFWIFIQDFCIELDIVGCDVPSAVSRLSRYRQLNWRDPFWQENRGRKMKGKESSGSRIRTHTDCFKGRRPTISRSPNKTIHSKTFHIRVSCGNRTRLSELEVQHLCRSAKDTIVFIAATTGLEPAFDSLTVSCRTVWLHRSV